MLSPEKIRATTGGIVTPPTLPKPHYPLLCTITLASLVKGEVLPPEKFRRLPEGLLPIRTNPSKTSPSLKNRHHPRLLMNVPFVLHPHYPTPRTTTLASLVKGEVLSPEKIRATTGGIVTPPTLPKPHYPLLCTITLASLVKGRWIDGKAQALILLLSACDMPTIFMLQTFCRQDGGIACYKLFQPCRHLR